MFPPPPPPLPQNKPQQEDAFRKFLLNKFGKFDGSTTDEIEKKLKKSEDIDETCFKEADGIGIFENQPIDTTDCQQCQRCEKWVKNECIQHHMLCHSSQILEWLYLGGAINSENEKELDVRTQISYILNVAAECPNYYPQKYKYLKMNFHDSIDQDILTSFEECYQFLENCRNEGKNVLVHCQLGKSRSATIVILYLMKHLNWKLREAFLFVKQKRSIVNPNMGFVKQLLKYDNELFGEYSITPIEINPLFKNMELE